MLMHTLWTTQTRTQLLPFWPQSGVRSMCLSVNDSTVSKVTRPFNFTETASLLLRCFSDEEVNVCQMPVIAWPSKHMQ